MGTTRLSRTISGRLKKRINRRPSVLLATGVPWLSIMLGSLSPMWPMIASAPLLPPLGLLMLMSWRQVRPGLLPVWVGLPLGLFDDIYSGQPLGSAVLLWSATLIVLELIETRFPWRHFLIDWLVSALIVCLCLLLSLFFANAAGGTARLDTIAPQIVISVVAIPLVGRLVAALDRFRLLPLVDTH